MTGSVAEKCACSYGRIVVAARVVKQRLSAARGIVVAAPIAEQREIPDRSVKESVHVALQG